MKTLIVPVNGKNERLKTLHIPKGLLPLWQRPILWRIIDSWKSVIDEVIIITNKDNHDIYSNYCKNLFTFENIKIKCVVHNSIDGSTSAILSVVRSVSNNKIIINWCDVLVQNLNEIPDIPTVLTNRDLNLRMKVIDGIIEINEQPGEGVLGVFFTTLSQLKKDVAHFSKGDDFSISLQSKKYAFIEHNDIIDIGDSEKFTPSLRKAKDRLIDRPFGSPTTVTIHEDFVEKFNKNKRWMNYEVNWYKDLDFDFTPKIISLKPFRMEKIEGMIGHEFLLNYPQEEKRIVQDIFQKCKSIHLSRPKKVAQRKFVLDQYINWPSEALEKINFLFSNFNKNKISINGKLYENPLQLMKNNLKIIESFFPDSFRPVHGDIQTSNFFVLPNGVVKVFDPQICFSDRDFFGDVDQDFAKFYYGFVGVYEAFAKGESHVLVDDKLNFTIKPLLEKEVYERRRNLFFEEVSKVSYTKVKKHKIDLLHALFWVHVSHYQANDTLSSLYGYLHGTRLLNKVLKNIKKEL